jgi:hypothetical protein
MCQPPPSRGFYSVFYHMTEHRFVNAASDSCHIREIKGSLTDENSGGGSVGCSRIAAQVVRQSN